MNGVIRGRVVDVAGDGAADASIMVIQAPGPVPDIAAVSNVDGLFVLSGLRAGTYRLKAVGTNGDSGETDATVSETGESPEVVIQLSRSTEQY